MRVVIVTLALSAAPALPAVCPDSPGAAPWARAGDERFLRPVFAAAELRKDIRYGEAVNDAGEKQVLLLDVYEPAGDKAPLRPAILWLHGGSFRPEYTKNDRYITDSATRFARYGYVGVSVEYRARRDQSRPLTKAVEDGRSDVLQAFAWIRAHAGEFRIDPEYVAVAGQSAGAMLAGSFTSTVKGIFAQALFWGQPFTPHVPDLRPGIGPCYPPTVFLTGNNDGSAPYTSAIEMAKALDAAGVRRRVQIVEDGTHSLPGREDEYVPMAARFFFERLTGSAPATYEGEQYSQMRDASFGKSSAGHSGTGYIEMEKSGWIEWDYVAAAAAGPHRISVRYSNPGRQAISCRVRINGKEQATIAFEPAASWSAAVVEVPLQTGENTLRLAAASDSGLRIDAIEISPK